MGQEFVLIFIFTVIVFGYIFIDVLDLIFVLINELGVRDAVQKVWKTQ